MKNKPNNSILTIHFDRSFGDVELPVLDITHPLFLANIDEKAYHMGLIHSAKSLFWMKRMPGFIKKLFIRTSNVESTYLSGMRTLVYKLGPGFMKGRRLNFRDKWAVKQDTFIGLRIRLREICRIQADVLIPLLQKFPGKGLCFFNIGGGPASDSINTLILIQEEFPDLLYGRKIEIDILDIDTFGPGYAKQCIEVLTGSGERFNGLDITLKTIQYDWRDSEGLMKVIPEKSEWIQLISSEGGLFEYGSDEDIIQNLNTLYESSAANTRIFGSMIFDKENVNSGYLGFVEFTGIKIRLLGFTGLDNILAQTHWVLESSREIDSVFIVFSLKKSDC